MDFGLKKTNTLEVRVRVCGLHCTKHGILLLKHEGIGKNGFLWSPPGGGIESNENARDALVREFKEETHLDILVKDFCFINEYLDKRVHAIELFFTVRVIGGCLKLGKDPELKKQILTKADYLSFEYVNQLNSLNKHNAFQFCSDAAQINKLRGYYFFNNI